MSTTISLQSVIPANVQSVYSGRKGACCCGCKGTHRYNSQHVAAATAARGYEITADEVNDVQITKILRTVQANEDSDSLDVSASYVAVDVGARSFIVYLVAGIEVAS